jgi:hypothetical protein
VGQDFRQILDEDAEVVDVEVFVKMAIFGEDHDKFVQFCLTIIIIIINGQLCHQHEIHENVHVLRMDHRRKGFKFEMSIFLL